jgi:hypothetical protein
MIDLGDRAEDSTINFTFPTQKADGTPITLLGSPVLSVYKDDNTTESTAGITLNVDHDSRTGMNHVKIILTDAFYVTGSDYSVVITTGTVNGVSVVGKTVAQFSIENRFMRGTDGANTTVPDAAGVAAGLHATTDALIAALNDVSVADLLTGNMTEAYAAQGAVRNLTKILFNIEALLSRFDWTAGTKKITTYKLNGITPAKTYTLDDADNPTDKAETT